jgi:3-hydroxyisobutyrate dehydrogenase
VQQPRIGLAGVGRMGSAIGERILAAGFPLTVYNRTAAKLAPLVDAGARPALSLRELSSTTDIILTVLTDDAAVDRVYAEVLRADVAGRLFVDASTIRAATIARLADRVSAAGARLVDAPLAGPPAAARAGQLMVMCGGTESDVAAATPMIEAYARRIVHLGAASSTSDRSAPERR